MALRFLSSYPSWADSNYLTDADGNFLTDDEGNLLTDGGIIWGIEIYDADFAGDEIEFRVAGGVKFDYRADGDSVIAPVMGSGIRFDMIIQDADHEDLITDIAAGKEGRFSVVINRNGSFYWAGVINSQDVTIEDADYPFAFTVTAVDGLALLKNFEYRQDITSTTKWETKYEGQSKLVTIISRCLKKLPHVVEHFTGLDPFIVTAVNWYNDSLPDPATETDDPFWLTWLDNRAFVNGQSSGNAKFMSCFDVISSILRAFNARIMLTDGYFLVEQVETRAFTLGSGENFARSYDYDLTAPVSFSLTEEQEIGRGDDIKKLRGGTYSFLPALRSVRAEQPVSALQNLLPAMLFSSAAPAGTYTVGWIYGDGINSKLRFTGTVEWNTTNNAIVAVVGTFYALFDLTLAVGDKWAKVDAVIDASGGFFTPSTLTWESSASVVKVKVKIDFAALTLTQTGSQQIDLGFKLHPDFQYGDLSVSFDLDSIAQTGFSSSGTINPTDYDFEWALKDAYANIQPTVSPFSSKSVVYEVEGDTENTQVLETKSLVGDRLTGIINQWGGLLYFDDPDYIYTENWGVRSGTRNRPITQLLAQRILSGQYFPRKVLRGTAVGNSIVLQVPVAENSDAYILKNGTYDTEKDELNGEWVRLAYTSAEFNYLDPEYDTGTYEGNTPGGGSTGNGTPTDNGSGTTGGTTGGNGIYGGSGSVPDGTVAGLAGDFAFFRSGASAGDVWGLTIDDGSNSNVIKAEAADGIVLQSTGDSIQIEGVTRLTDIITAFTINSSQNDYAGLDGANVGRVSASTAVNITGLDSGLGGRILAFLNRGSNPITITNADTGSAADNRFDSGRPYVVRNKRAGLFIYDDIDDRWVVCAMGDLSYFNEAYATATQTVASFTADAPATNIGFAIVPKGTGPVLAAVPDGASTGGNARGTNATDLQTDRNAATQVAGGNYSTIPGGRRCTASGTYSFATGFGGNASGAGAVAFGGAGSFSVGATATGDNSFAMGTGADATAVNAFAFNGDASAQDAVAFHANADKFGMFRTRSAAFLRWINDIRVGTGVAELFLDGSSLRATIPSGERWQFEICVFATITVVGNGSGTINHQYFAVYTGVVRNIGGTTSLLGTVDALMAAKADATIADASFAITADDTNDALVINFTPPTSAGTTTQHTVGATMKFSIF